ncbi:MAG: MFS transporter [Bacteriovoracaceae bacterium]|nr:MFS transporter [Bacteriovoracaceae bacterium]
MSLSLMFRDRKFAPLMWAQFFGALNDNILKNALVVLLAIKEIQLLGLKSELLVTMITLIFILPFFFFSELAGQIADKYEKSRLVRIIKTAEIFIMLIAGLGFYFENYFVLIFSIFLLGLHSTFFGPIKYSSIPDLLSEQNLTSGNAYVEMGTFIAILIGTISGGYLISLSGGALYVIVFLILNALMGLYFGIKLPRIPNGNSHLKLNFHPWKPLIATCVEIKKNKTVFHSILGISWFWLLGAVILSVLPSLSIKVLHGNPFVVTSFLACFTIGIAIGAVICERLSFGRTEIGLVPLGSLGMSLFLADIARVLGSWNQTYGYVETNVSVLNLLSRPLGINLYLDIFAIAIFGGLYTVPLYTLVSQRSSRETRSRAVGANNILNSLFMVLGSALLMGFFAWDFSLSKILLIYAALNFIVSFYIYSIVPEFTLRFFMWVGAKIFFRLAVRHQTNIPKEGAALLISNHVSYIDWMLIGAAIKRPVRFVMYYKFARTPMLRYLMNQAGVILIAGKAENEKIFQEAFDKISQALINGELVCLFPEGSITRDGKIQEFKKGMEFILARNPVPVIPMFLEGVWGSLFSPDGKKIWKKLLKIPLFSFLLFRHKRVILKISDEVKPGDTNATHLEGLIRKLETTYM